MYLHTLIRSPLTLLFWLNSLSSLSFSLYGRCLTSSWLFAGLGLVSPCLSYTGEPRPGHITPDVALPPVLCRGRITSCDLVVLFFLMRPRRLLATFATTVHCWLIVSLLSTRTPNPPLPSCLPACWPLAFAVVWHYSSLGARLCISLC